MKILICDDSAVARKSIARTILPINGLQLLEAQDGFEALRVLKEHDIDILFLDLTMPIMSGFEVLESMPVNNYKTRVVVMSGDVQKESKKRCLAQGVSGFITKPLEKEQLCSMYQQLGIHYIDRMNKDVSLYITTHIPPSVKFREVANIALGKGAAIIADHLCEFIQLPVPHVGPLSFGELHMMLVDVVEREGAVAVAQRFVGGGIHGEALVCLRGKEIKQVGERLGYPFELTPHNEIILNVANLLVSSFLSSLGYQLNKSFSLRQPTIIDNFIPYSDDFTESGELFTIEYTYRAELLDFECEVLFLMDKSSVKTIYDIMEVI